MPFSLSVSSATASSISFHITILALSCEISLWRSAHLHYQRLAYHRAPARLRRLLGSITLSSYALLHVAGTKHAGILTHQRRMNVEA
jgi:hypothetical protein